MKTIQIPAKKIKQGDKLFEFTNYSEYPQVVTVASVCTAKGQFTGAELTTVRFKAPDGHEAHLLYHGKLNNLPAETATLVVEEDEEPAAQQYRVVAVSNNTNSFGLKSILLLAPTGEGFEILKSAYNGEALPSVGDLVPREKWGSYECPRQLGAVAPKIAEQIISKLNPSPN